MSKIFQFFLKSRRVPKNEPNVNPLKAHPNKIFEIPLDISTKKFIKKVQFRDFRHVFPKIIKPNWNNLALTVWRLSQTKCRLSKSNITGLLSLVEYYLINIMST